MWDNDPEQELAEKMLQFIESSVSEIYQTQDVDAYMQWVKTNYTEFLPAIDDSLRVALFVARTIWSATPLPINRYRPSPLPELKRNSPCFCDSGKKFKQCCLNISDGFPPIDIQHIWILLVEEMTPNEIREALALHALPVSAMLALAEQYYDDGMVLEVIEILEPVFTLPSEKMGENECIALNLLCNAYDGFDFPELKAQKMGLLHHLKEQGSRLIRSEAWQRLAVNFLDNGEEKSAWKAFQTAQRLTPNSPSVDLLEINLLLGERKDDLAQQRAKMILKKMQKNGTYEDSPFNDFFLAVAENPQKVVKEYFDGRDSDQIAALRSWLEQVAGRKLPVYKLESFVADYHWMQEEKTQVIQVNLFAKDEDDEIFDNLSEKEYRLITPKSIKKLEQRWSHLIDECEGNSFPWDENEWLEFLNKNPQCFGSTEIIESILTGLEEWQQDEKILKDLSLPLAKRAWQIYESLPEQGAMSWGFIENRPLYSALFSIVQILKLLDQKDEAMYYAKRLIAINPRDNHALRGELVNYFLAQKAYDKAFKLTGLYPQDILLETHMAKVLSLWMLGHIDSALEQWQQIKKHNQFIKKYMVSSAIAPPDLDSYAFTLGGEDEAWYYRETARDIWLDHRGAIAWLKQN